MAILTMMSTLTTVLLQIYLSSLPNVFYRVNFFTFSKETYHKHSWDNRILHCSKWPAFPSHYTQGLGVHRGSDYKLLHKGKKQKTTF